MSFQNISKVENVKKMLDFAITRSKKVNMRKTHQGTLDSVARLESARLDVINTSIHTVFMRIIKEFPSVDSLPEFYSELLEVTMDKDMLKQSLGAVNWADNKIKELVITHKKKIFTAKSIAGIREAKKSYLGRLSSVLKQIDKKLTFLDDCRRTFRTYPTIKRMFTVCIAGFPNVGKSTLLGKITTSRPEIKDYAFTTKTLNLGYFEGKKKAQIIDTPGTLARPEKMNNIERQAYLAIKYQADIVVFVFDPTDSYPFDQQEELLALVKEFKKPMLIYLSKTDIQKDVSYFKKFDYFNDAEKLKEKILEMIPEEVVQEKDPYSDENRDEEKPVEDLYEGKD